MLAMSAAAGGLALSSGVRRASAQTEKRIERLAPELDGGRSAVVEGGRLPPVHRHP
jgi:hypothetical protein